MHALDELVLDGELYNHEFKFQFEKIVSFVRQEEPAPGHEVVQYHVYDLPYGEPFSKRAEKLRYMKDSWFPNGEVQKVETVRIDDETQALEYFEKCKLDGYEGAMLRNVGGLYVNKRSMDLQKMKEFEDAEFDIVGIEEGRGKLSGHVGAFKCKDSRGVEFLAKMAGDTGRLRDYFENDTLWRGKRLTVKYQGLTGANGVPRFPVGLRIRDED
jgi:ATP-dependent DNA ligase